VAALGLEVGDGVEWAKSGPVGLSVVGPQRSNGPAAIAKFEG
jgi:hypothetical protein